MLKLYSVRKQDVVYTFLGGRKYAVGRKTGDITLPDDQSISRNHAEVEVDHPRANLDNPALQPTLMVTCLGSKFGTYINEQIDADSGVRLNMREPVNLESGARIRFGRQWNEFKFEYTPLVVTCSTLRDTAELKELICELGGHLVSDWTPECRYVVMDTVTLTIKAVCALLSGGYIVSPDYFKTMVDSILSSKSTQLDPMDYTPPLAEIGLPSSNVNFQPLPARSTLFRGKIFLFYNNKQMKKLGILVQTGGGESKLISECSSSKLGSSNILMMNPPVDIKLLDRGTLKAIDMYKASGKRLLQESEISLAAVYVSIGKQCNPHFDYAQRIFPPMPSQTQRSPHKGSVIIPETQSSAETQRSDVGDFSRNTVEESLNMTPCSERAGSSFQTSRTQIKKEKDDGGAMKRGGREQESSSSKRRLDCDTETSGALAKGPESKRQKSSQVSQNLTKSKTLNALFKMSDSDDDDEISCLEDPQSQSQRRTTNVSGVGATAFDFVGISKKNLRSPNKNSAGPSNAGRDSTSQGAPLVDFVPSTPDMSQEDENMFPGLIQVTSNQPRREDGLEITDIENNTTQRNNESIDEQILPTAQMPTMAIPTAQMATLILPQASRFRRTTQENQESASSSTSKRRREGADVVVHGENKHETKKAKIFDIFGKKTSSTSNANDSIDKKLGGMMINGDATSKKKIATDITDLLKPAPVVFASLILRDRPPFDSRPQSTANSVPNTVPNFKKFQKVWPLTLYNPSNVKEAEKNLKSSIHVPSTSVRITPSQRPSKKQKKKDPPRRVDEDCFVVPSTSRGTRTSSRNAPQRVVKKEVPAPRIVPKSPSKRRALTSEISDDIDTPMNTNNVSSDDEPEELFDF